MIKIGIKINEYDLFSGGKTRKKANTEEIIDKFITFFKFINFKSSFLKIVNVLLLVN